MQSRLNSRIAQLEKSVRKPPAPTVFDTAPALLLASRLAALGVERGHNESLAETTARAMGISVQELRAELLRRAGNAWLPILGVNARAPDVRPEQRPISATRVFCPVDVVGTSRDVSAYRRVRYAQEGRMIISGEKPRHARWKSHC